MKNIIIDIGHAGGTGARGNGLEEHAVNTVIAKILSQKLFESGYNTYVIDFPDNNNRDDLNKTVATANKIDAELGISLHSDASDNPQAHGRPCMLLLE